MIMDIIFFFNRQAVKNPYRLKASCVTISHLHCGQFIYHKSKKISNICYNGIGGEKKI